MDYTVYNQDQTALGVDQNTKRFRFFPTRLVTKQVFIAMKKGVGQQMLFHGNYGVGKTSAFILYCELAKIINDYIYAIKLKNEYDQNKLA